jgi:glutamate 5-kinase
VVDRNGREVARGLTNYSSADLKRIRGQRSENIEEILGYVYGHEVIHRDNMVLL